MEEPKQYDSGLFMKKVKDELRQCLIQIFNNEPVFSFAYLMINKVDSMPAYILSDYPLAWLNRYQSYGYQHIDPVLMTARRHVAPFIWRNKVDQVKLSNFFNMSEDYAISNGYTFTLHDPDNNLATLTLRPKVEGPDFYEIMERNKEHFQMLLINVHEKMINFIQLQATVSDKKNVMPVSYRLSPRETEVLFWASVGKTYSEISMVLSIREGTVKFHIRNIIEKLGVSNAKHAISKAVELKLFS